MGYLFLLIALAGGCAKAYCGKKISTEMENSTDSLIINLSRMLLCSAIGFVIALSSAGALNVFKVDLTFIAVSLISGVCSALFVILWLISVKSGAYAMVDTFVMAGALVPMLGSALLFKEHIRLIQWLGFAVVISGVVILCSYNNSVKARLNSKALLLLICTGLASGFADLSQKMFTHLCEGGNNGVFNFYTYVFSAIVILALLLFRRVKPEYAKRKIKSVWIYVGVMAAGLFINSYFKVEAARLIDAAKLYPLNQGAALALGAIMASLFFGEKISLKCIIGLALGFTGICIINLF